MNRVGAALFRGRDQLGRVEVAPDRDGLVGRECMKGFPVRLRRDRDRHETGLAAGAGDAAGDFATVRDQDLAQGALRELQFSNFNFQANGNFQLQLPRPPDVGNWKLKLEVAVCLKLKVETLKFV